MNVAAQVHPADALFPDASPRASPGFCRTRRRRSACPSPRACRAPATSACRAGRTASRRNADHGAAKGGMVSGMPSLEDTAQSGSISWSMYWRPPCWSPVKRLGLCVLLVEGRGRLGEGRKCSWPPRSASPWPRGSDGGTQVSDLRSSARRLRGSSRLASSTATIVGLSGHSPRSCPDRVRNPGVGNCPPPKMTAWSILLCSMSKIRSGRHPVGQPDIRKPAAEAQNCSTLRPAVAPGMR